MAASTIAIGIAGGAEFAATDELRPSDALLFSLDSAVDVAGAFGRRQNDVRAALDGEGALLLLVGPRIAEGLATQFGCWIRAKVGLDLLPWEQPRVLAEGGEAYAEVRFFGVAPEGAKTIARSETGEVAGVCFRGGAATIIVAPLEAGATAMELLRRWA